MQHSHTKLTVRSDIKQRVLKIKRNNPRLPMVEIVDAVFDGWDQLEPSQQERALSGRRDRRERQTA